MHEVGLLQNMLDVIREFAARHRARAVHRVTLRVGGLSGVVPEALEFAFTVVTRGTIAEGARLVIERVPVVCRCPDCGCEFEPPDVIYACPGCGQISADVLRGKELELASLEVS
jgi:hydrogenase nickel incorporation protein HypA/HybF